ATQGLTTIDGSAMAIKPIICLDQRNEVQHDAVLFIPSRQATIGSEDFIEGAPELIVEIAASSAAIDLHEKKQVYARKQVQEYMVWRTLDKQIDWFVLVSGDYQQHKSQK
ncbi:MAG: Uma2 family endonuclease, partial [Gloeomargarita sp. SKYB31]|nr:Uma2 family endonuclease [Gloeomargarita sp. SKYB31]